MKKLLLVSFAVLFAASAAYADYTVSYGWEDGPPSTILGSYGNLVDDLNVTGAYVGQSCGSPNDCPGAYEGVRYLHVAESPHSGTPQAYLACITGLAEGDSVHASFWGYDITPGASPSVRIWGHYSDAVTCPDCPGEYTGSAGGDAGYTDGTGWSQVSHTFVFTSSGDDFGLVIEGRLYSTPSTDETCYTDHYIDLITVTVPDHAHVLFPDMTGPSATENSTWGGIKALYR